MPSIGTLLIESGAIEQKHFDEALQCQVLFGGSIGTNLLELGYVSEDTLAGLLAKQLQVGTPDVRELEHVSDEVIASVPATMAEDLCAVPFRREGGKLSVAMADPRDEATIRELEKKTGAKVVPHVVVEARLAYMLEKYYGLKREQRYINLIRQLANRQGAEPAKSVLPFKAPAAPAGGPIGHFGRMSSHHEKPRKAVRITPAELGNMLDSAKTRDDVAQVILSYAQNYLKRACLLVVKRDTVYGWAGYGEELDPAAVRGIMVPLSPPSVFKTVTQTRGPYLGPMADTVVNKRFLSACGDIAPKTVIVVPIAYGDNPIALLYGDNGSGKGVPPGNVADLQILSDKVAHAFHLIIERLRAGQREDTAARR